MNMMLFLWYSCFAIIAGYYDIYVGVYSEQFRRSGLTMTVLERELSGIHTQFDSSTPGIWIFSSQADCRF